jgi:PAS domain S-box-containing protein
MSNKRAHPGGRVLSAGLRVKADALQKSRRNPGPSLRKPPLTALEKQTSLRTRLKAAEETLRAIQSGKVDALVIAGPHGERVVSLKGGEPTYRMLVEAMSEGAATLSRDGTVLYCNRRFEELMGRRPGKMIGIAVQSLVAKAERGRFEALLAVAQKAVAKGEFNLRGVGESLPAYLSLNRFRGYKGHALGMVITEPKRAKAYPGRVDQTGRDFAPAPAGAHAFRARGRTSSDCARIT